MVVGVIDRKSGIGVRVREARLRSGLSQQQLADSVGVSQPAINKLESNPKASSRKLVEIARALGVDAQWLAGGGGSAAGLKPARLAAESIDTPQPTASRPAGSIGTHIKDAEFIYDGRGLPVTPAHGVTLAAPDCGRLSLVLPSAPLRQLVKAMNVHARQPVIDISVLAAKAVVEALAGKSGISDLPISEPAGELLVTSITRTRFEQRLVGAGTFMAVADMCQSKIALPKVAAEDTAEFELYDLMESGFDTFEPPLPSYRTFVFCLTPPTLETLRLTVAAKGTVGVERMMKVAGNVTGLLKEPWQLLLV